MAAPFTDTVADGIALLHAVVIAFYIAGAASVLQGAFFRPSLKLWQYCYLGLVLLMSLSILSTGNCCLTDLENAIRATNHPNACYQCSYVAHYFPFVPKRVDAYGSVLLLLAGCAATLSAMWSGLSAKRTQLCPRAKEV